MLFDANKMDEKKWEKMRQQTWRSAVWAESIKLFTNSSQNGLLICASSLQVHLSVHINVLSNSNFNSKIYNLYFRQ